MLLTLSSAGLLAACALAPVTATVESSDPAALMRARTFAIESPPAGGLTLDPRLRAAIDGGLTDVMVKRGYRAAAAPVDLRVVWRVAPAGREAQDARGRPALEAHTSIGPGDPFDSYRAPGGADAGTDRGLLAVTIVDAAGAVVWQATSEAMATGRASAVEAGHRAAKAALAGVPKAAAR
jgi:hypothetical protein